MNCHKEALEQVNSAFASETGPARCQNPRHCEECKEADEMLLNLDPRDLNYNDLSSERCNWIFAFATPESIRWLTPGMIRVSLEQEPPEPWLFFEFISQRTSDAFSEEQWITILDFVDYCCDSEWISRSELGFIGPGAHRSGEQN